MVYGEILGEYGGDERYFKQYLEKRLINNLTTLVAYRIVSVYDKS